MPNFKLPSEAEQRAFVDALEENFSKINKLSDKEILGFVSRVMDISGILPSTITNEIYTKISANGIGVKETSFALAMIIAKSFPEGYLDEVLSDNGVEFVRAEVSRYIEVTKD